MSDSAPKLEQIQHWMQAVITHPSGVIQGLESQEARRHVNLSAEDVEQVIGRSETQTSVERLEIYAHAYYARLLECLRDEFPVLSKTLGKDPFDGLAFGYLQQYPSRSYTLNQLGGNFPQYLAATRPARNNGHAADWADFLVDLAMLERTISEVFDGPGAEGRPLLSAEQLQAVPARQISQLRLVPVPCLRVLQFRFSVNSYFTAVRQNQNPGFPSAAESFIAVSRRQYVVRRYELSRPQYELLRALLNGLSLGQAIQSAAEVTEQSVETWSRDLHLWFRTWTDEGFFQSLDWSG